MCFFFSLLFCLRVVSFSTFKCLRDFFLASGVASSRSPHRALQQSRKEEVDKRQQRNGKAKTWGQSQNEGVLRCIAAVLALL
jgi:hypothetical protein